MNAPLTPPSPSPCPECSAHHNHSIDCSLMTVEERAAKMRQYYHAWLRDTSHYRDLCTRYRKEIILWQGKHAMLRHENNKLRAKVRKLQPTPSSSLTSM